MTVMRDMGVGRSAVPMGLDFSGIPQNLWV